MKHTKKRRTDGLKILFMYVAAVAAWQLCYYLFAERLGLVKPYIFPSPLGIVQSLIRLVESNLLLTAVLSSFRKMLTGFSMSIVLGALLGLILTRSAFVSKAVKPLILGMQTLPSICFVPFALLWFGLTDTATIFVIVVGSFFSVSLSIEQAIKNVSPVFIRAAKTMGANRAQVYTRVILPASVPDIIAGLKHGWSFAWRALIAGEMISGTIGGLGYVLLTGRELLDINQIMVVIIVIILISVVIEKLLFGRVETAARRKLGVGITV